MQVRQPVFRLISNIDVKNWRATFCLDYVPPGFNLWPRREAKIPRSLARKGSFQRALPASYEQGNLFETGTGPRLILIAAFAAPYERHLTNETPRFGHRASLPSFSLLTPLFLHFFSFLFILFI